MREEERPGGFSRVPPQGLAVNLENNKFPGTWIQISGVQKGCYDQYLGECVFEKSSEPDLVFCT